MDVRMGASQSERKKKNHAIMFCMHRMVLFTTFNALISGFLLDSLSWVSFFLIQTDQTTLVSTQSTIKD